MYLPNAPFSTATLTLLFGCYPFSRNKQVASGIHNGQQVDKKNAEPMRNWANLSGRRPLSLRYGAPSSGGQHSRII
jgi:hypothetical protein